ncbi:hypothetical protein PVAP13_8KG388805 [Panicum virgatum]|uniref:Uncharacterized protein n=1 Tax=Panicum virgatum TaxID=38727 RepID=A0A8T0PQB9_PANVG|nr:hypothetical protein PVAP13_8KG388805 [Panicum virgatum]
MTTMGAKANFRSTTSCKIAAAAIVLTIAAVAPLLVSTVKAPVPHSWSSSSHGYEWPCNPLGPGSTLEQCQEWCRRLGHIVATYHNDVCCCL